MKKILAAILAFIYLSTSMGATLHLHYCMDKLVSWGFLDQESKDCSFCLMPKKDNHQQFLSEKKGCCKDEHKLIKTDKDQKIIPAELQLLKHFPCGSADNYLVHPDLRISSFTVQHPTANSPPRIGKVTIFLLHRNFRI